MSEYLLVNDIHLSDQVPSSCTATYLDDLLDMLRAIGDIARERHSRGIIWAGDVFHHKTPGRTSHATIMRVIDILRAYPCPTWVVPGNHDLLHDRLDSLTATQPLGVLIASGALRLLNGWLSSGAGDLVYGLPWLSRYTTDTVEAALADWRHCDPEDAHKLLVTHAPLYPPGKELPYENYPAAQWAEAMGHDGTVHYGHVHDAHHIYEVDGVVFSNPGSLSRGSLTENHLTRKVCIAAWDIDTGEIRHLDVPHKPADEVFRLAAAAEVKTAAVELSEFLSAVGETRLETTSLEIVIDHIRSRDDIDEELKAIVVRLLREEAPA